MCAAAAEASHPHPADTSVSAGSQHQPATSVAGSRGASPRENVDPELVVDYSGKSDDICDSKPPAILPGLLRGDTSTSYSKTRGSGTLVSLTYREMFGSSDKLDDSVGDRKDDVGDYTDINTRGVGTSAETNASGVGYIY